ncbi:MAG: rhodanese-like domain-containing protein [Bacteroidia bacterium]
MKEITVHELKEKMDRKEDFQLIDVREPFEFEICNLSGELIPMGIFMTETERVSKDKPVIIHCKSGGRSSVIVNELMKQGYENVYNLKGGILAYVREIDPTMTAY